MDILFSIIIPTYNSCKDLSRLLTSLALIKDELGEVEIIVVDDGSFDDTEKVARSMASSFERMDYFFQKNRGPAAARNLGARKAKGDYFIFLDDDCLFPKGCLRAIREFYSQKVPWAGLGMKTANSSRSIFSEYNQRLGDHLIEASRASSGNYEYVSSRCYSFSRESFWAIGGHDEEYVWPAAEDRDLCLRIKNKGFRLGYLQSVAVVNTDHLRFQNFMKTNFVYGLGSGLFRQKNRDASLASFSRYQKMLSDITGNCDPAKRIKLLSTFFLAQICSAAGMLFYELNYHYRNRPPSVFPPKYFICLEAVKNFVLGIPFFKAAKNASGSVSTGEELYSAGCLAFSAQKAYGVYKDALKETGDKNWIQGKRVLEIGPGSHLGVSLSFIAQGASQVVAIDKYGEVKFRKKEALIYEQILASFSEQELDRVKPWLEKLTSKEIAVFDPARPLNYLRDVAIDKPDILRKLSAGSFDLIVSFNTLEHIKNLTSAFRHMELLLRTGGMAIHRVDAGSHYAIYRHTKNRLSQFLFSEATYEMMFSHRDAPTRKVFSDYKRIAQEAKIPIKEVCVDEMAGECELGSGLKFLDKRFRDFSKEEMEKVGFIFTAKKK